MLARGSGKIIFTASLLSFQGGINVPGYAAAKSGIAGLTRALANEWAGTGVNVNAIAPGYIATDNTQALQDDSGPRRGDPRAHPGRALGQTPPTSPARRCSWPRRRPTTSAASCFPSTAGGWADDACAASDDHRRVTGSCPVVVADDADDRRAARARRSRRRAADGRDDLPYAGGRGGDARHGRPTRYDRRRRHGASRAEQVDRAVDAGAPFIVSPGLQHRGRRTGARARDPCPSRRGDADGPHGALDARAVDVVKFFPAERRSAARRRSRRSRRRSPACASCPPAASPPQTLPDYLRCPLVLGGRRHAGSRSPDSPCAAAIRRDPATVAAAAVADRGRSAVMSLTLRPADDCRYDVVSLGEVMLRLDPGEGRIRTTRSFDRLGGRRRVQRRPRAAPLLRPADGDGHRAGRQRGRSAGRGPDPAGRRRHRHAPLGPVRRRRPDGPQRPQLHRARIRRPRRGRRVRPRAHRVAASCGRATSTGTSSSGGRACAGSTPAASSPGCRRPPRTWWPRRWPRPSGTARSCPTT